MKLPFARQLLELGESLAAHLCGCLEGPALWIPDRKQAHTPGLPGIQASALTHESHLRHFIRSCCAFASLLWYGQFFLTYLCRKVVPSMISVHDGEAIIIKYYNEF